MGLLAAAQIALAPRGSRQSRALALLRTKRYDDNSKVLAAVAKMLWSLGKSNKARSWFEKAVAANADDGDAWCEYVAFETQCAGGAARALAVLLLPRVLLFFQKIQTHTRCCRPTETGQSQLSS